MIVTEVSVPEEIGTFKLAETHRYPDPRLGTLYRYRNDSELRPDVYIYPVDDAPGARPLNPARNEGMNFGQVLTAQRNQRRISSFQIVESAAREHITDTDTIPGWHVYAVLESARGKSDSHLYLYAVGDTMVKIRSTSPEGSVDGAQLEDFVLSLLQAVTAKDE